MPRSAPPARRAPAAAPRARKNMRIDQGLLDSAKRILGTESETETVARALRIVIGNARVAAGIRALGGSRIVDRARIDD